EITGGVILAKSVSRVELENILSQDPFATGGLATYEVIEFTPTKWSKEFEGTLFADSGDGENETRDD
ncbi:MAG: hypothetical protein SFT91_01145, partial [Rickettsiaceae bacterium]|nr:hypothetical protein [Rickettsiaceae bacterium]